METRLVIETLQDSLSTRTVADGLILQLSLSNSSYTIVILISITELGSVALTVLGFKSDSETFFFS